MNKRTAIAYSVFEGLLISVFCLLLWLVLSGFRNGSGASENVHLAATCFLLGVFFLGPCIGIMSYTSRAKELSSFRETPIDTGEGATNSP